MRKIQTQGVHHITINGANRQTAIDFWEGVLGGHTHTDVLLEPHKLRVEHDDPNIDRVHLADAIELLVARSQVSLSEDRSPRNPYRS